MTSTMKAIGVLKYLPSDDPGCFIEKDIEIPEPAGREILVKVNAISVNPVDVKRRASKKDDGKFTILGWDVSGTVVKTGKECSLFRTGDHVYFAGNTYSNGSNSEYAITDERIAGRKPSNLSDAETAALALTGITAWEAMFDRMSIPDDPILNRNKSILLIGAAGGVGSIASQLASLYGLIVIGTASRPESVEWARDHGVDYVVSRKENLVSQVHDLGFDYVDYIFCMNSLEEHWDAMVELIAPMGRICTIVNSKEPVDVRQLWSKAATFSFEFMSTRPNHKTGDMQLQHDILESIASMVEQGSLKSTLNVNLGKITTENLAKAHRLIESGNTIGKVVLESF